LNERIVVRFTREADENADAIFEWIAERSHDGARRWTEALEVAIGELSQSADSFGAAPESATFSETIRQFTFSTKRGRRYRLLYVVRGSIVHVVAIRSAGQELLEESDNELPGSND
jgi:plasmid stabilization system protein ParE